MTTIKQEQIVTWLKTCAEVFAAQRDFLTDLDKEIGDADHGINMNRGFEKVAEKLPTFEDQNIEGVLKATGMALMSSIGGASGPLYGTFFIRASAAAKGKEELELADLVAVLDAAVAGVVARGKAEPGDKTMCDVWWPVLEAAKAADTLEAALPAMVTAAEAGVQSTVDMQARKGRASYLGERSIGHQDAGATSSMLMVKTLKETVLGA
ncbi:dihydroxyacetone kinase ADP-binding subunit DhaL [Rhodobacteraceae bacterium RKSG542]|uniref:dihydroxyacetone kinase subunit DhaL n=1 Tax=Pseudovibrio flavus TaxID=2529854 RepID=UPI0012BD802A|nr:dihydroxyacetone kinase subunit DhaL [Pseudovibrio flavus]MTI16504.1 dihydroxyacetone kinase ADP-binding subunit DhaL [Pseudovibrio flavus]